MTARGFARFYQLVLHDQTLQAQLRECREPRHFISEVVRLGAEQGYHFSAEEVSMAMNAYRRAWVERWIR